MNKGVRESYVRNFGHSEIGFLGNLVLVPRAFVEVNRIEQGFKKLKTRNQSQEFLNREGLGLSESKHEGSPCKNGHNVKSAWDIEDWGKIVQYPAPLYILMRHICGDIIARLFVRVVWQLFPGILVYKGYEFWMCIPMLTCNILVRNEDEAINVRFVESGSVCDH